jgi:hypothetical protein
LSKLIAIHQPNFFPWLGYFNKIARSDKFIFLDNVQFSKTGGGWGNRVQLLINNSPTWVTMPIVRAYHGTRCIYEMEINNNTPWREKMMRTFTVNYGRTPFFKEVFPILEMLINYPTNSLADYNINAIRTLSLAMELDISKLISGSSLDVGSHATDLLIEMVKAVGGTTYLSGGGADGYQEDEKYESSGIKLIYQDFQHPEYSQHKAKDFVPGMSILDTLMNCGFEQTSQLIGSV